MKLLIVEDEVKAGQYLQQGLSEAGYIVDVANNGADGLHLSLTESYDLILLDVMLPDIDGWNILETLRRSEKMMPVMFLTAKDQVTDRVRGLELGADDYLVKPFAFSELLARVRTILKRSMGTTAAPSPILQLADLSLDRIERRVMRAGTLIDLTAKEFTLLEFFLQKKGEVLSRSLIASQVWDMNFDSDTNVIDVAVKRLRIKVDQPFDKKLIHTIRGMGYVMDDNR